MSLVTFNNVRYYTADDTFHYTVDNRPLQDLASNDVLLQAGLDILAAAISNGGLTVKDFIAGTDFVAGTNNSLTLPSPPTSLSSVWVYFDGIFQNSNTYSVSGSTVLFSSVIPSGVSSIEVRWSNTNTNNFSTTLVVPITNASYSLPIARDVLVQYTGALTGNVTTTLTASSTQGYKVRVVRDATATGAFSVTVQTSGSVSLKVLNAAGTWADFIYSGSGWIQTAAGSL